MFVQVTCKRTGGAWRAKRHWPKGTVEAEVTAEDFAALQAHVHLEVKQIHELTGATLVDEAQPAPPLPESEKPLPELFPAGTTARKRQEQLLKEDAEYQERLAREQARKDRPPPEGTEPEGVVVTKVESAKAQKPAGKK